MSRRLLAIAIGLLLSAGAALLHADDRSFHDRVAPVLRRHCLRCHQGNKPKGGLDLATAKGLFAGADGNPVVVPGKPDESRLIEVVSGDKPEMPKNGKPLLPREIQALREWIAAGADWPDATVLKDDPLDWWSLRPIVRLPCSARESFPGVLAANADRRFSCAGSRVGRTQAVCRGRSADAHSPALV